MTRNWFRYGLLVSAIVLLAMAVAGEANTILRLICGVVGLFCALVYEGDKP